MMVICDPKTRVSTCGVEEIFLNSYNAVIISSKMPTVFAGQSKKRPKYYIEYQYICEINLNLIFQYTMHYIIKYAEEYDLQIQLFLVSYKYLWTAFYIINPYKYYNFFFQRHSQWI